MPHLSELRLWLAFGITLTAVIWLAAVWLQKVDSSKKLYQTGYVVGGWFLAIGLDAYFGTGRGK